MSVDLTHIIRHDFYRVHDKDASRDFVVKTIEQLKTNLLIQDIDECWNYRYDGDCNETSFMLPYHDYQFILHNGFWLVETYFRYHQIVMHDGNDFWLRKSIFDIVKALGQDEVWHAEEFYTWNGGACEDTEVSFEQWLKSSTDSYGKPIPEFDQYAIIAQGDITFPRYEPLYHDSLAECKELFNTIQSQLSDYRLIGISKIADKYLRCEKNGTLHFINEETLEPMFKEPIDGIYQTLNGPEFIVKKNGLSAVFDSEGQQLTDFVKGDFLWKLTEKHNYRIIYNDIAGITIR